MNDNDQERRMGSNNGLYRRGYGSPERAKDKEVLHKENQDDQETCEKIQEEENRKETHMRQLWERIPFSIQESQILQQTLRQQNKWTDKFKI